MKYPWISNLYKSSLYLALSILSVGLFAQTYPDHPISLIVPNPPGGLVDTSARLVSEPLGRLLNQTVIVDNKPGGSGNVAYQQVARGPK